MRIHYRIADGTGVTKLANRPGILNQKVMYRIGQAVRATTVKLTSEGVDYRGRAFAKYGTRRIYVPLSHKPKPKGGRRKHLKTGRPLTTVAYDGGYAQYRAAHGRSASKPDLQLTGKMLGAFQIVRVSSKLVRLGFVSKAEQNKALGNITGISGRRKRNPREFVGIGPQHQNAIEAEMFSRIREVVEDHEHVEIRRIA